MNMNDTLSRVNELLISASSGTPTPQAVEMTAPEFLSHVQAEVEKAKKEDPEKAKKRLAHLQKTVAQLSKSSWESTERQTVPMYEDSDITSSSEKSETETGLDAAAGKGTQADVSFAGPGGAQSFDKNLDALNKSIEAMLAPETEQPVAPPASSLQEAPGFWPGNVNTPAFMKDGVTKRAPDASDWGSDPWAAKR